MDMCWHRCSVETAQLLPLEDPNAVPLEAWGTTAVNEL